MTPYEYMRFLFVILFLVVGLMNVSMNQNAFINYLRRKEALSNQINAVSRQINELQNNLQMLHKFEEHLDIVEQYYKPRKTWLTSNLGTYLFKNLDHTNIERMTKADQVFNVMLWKHTHWLRHSNSTKSGVYLLNGCNVDNCRFSNDPGFDLADAVVIHLHNGNIPRVIGRDSRQIWIFLTDESPLNTFASSQAVTSPRLSKLANIFNWSMTYRTDSDVPVPYGRTVPLPYPKFKDTTHEKLLDLIPYWKTKQFDVLATILISNCQAGHRMQFLKELMLYMSIDIHGKCASNKNNTKSCPGHTNENCPIVSKYLFYLAFENSKCRQYLSEKSFHHAYSKGAIPVIMGPPVEDCNSLLPPNSFLHVDQFETVKKLALEMLAISMNVTRFLSYHTWRNNFEVINEHGYFKTQSFHLCRICQALNYNDRQHKVYNAEDIRLFLDSKLLGCLKAEPSKNHLQNCAGEAKQTFLCTFKCLVKTMDFYEGVVGYSLLIYLILIY